MIGSGTFADPFIIQNVLDLQAMETDLAAYYELESDINALATVGWNWNAGWGNFEGFIPIGRTSPYFTGHFDGKGYKISDLFLNRWPGGESSVGLFGRVSGARIQNVELENVDITGGGFFVGALAGAVRSTSRVTNVSSSGSVTGNDYIGGLTGILQDSIMTSSHSSVNVVSGGNDIDTYAGGLVGYHDAVTQSTIGIKDCYATGTVTAPDGEQVGGLVGYNVKGEITQCHATGNVSAANNTTFGRVGGLVGNNGVNGIISKSYATGHVAGDDRVGGLVGQNAGLISICYARGDVDGVDQIGGLIGYQQSGFDIYTVKSYSTGAVTGTSQLGGLIGYNARANAAPGVSTDPATLVSAINATPNGTLNYDGYSVKFSFWDVETSGQAASSGGGTGKTTAEMKTETTFTNEGWDFATLWDITPGVNNDYPSLYGVTPGCAIPSGIYVPTTICEFRFQYGLTDSYGLDTAWESTDGSFSETIFDLVDETLYHFKAQARNGVGLTSGINRSFTTLRTPVSPSVRTLAATGIT